MKLQRLLMFGIFLFSAVFGYANDAAMVVSGEATARLGEETWPVELAEMLPEDVELTVGSEASMKLIHLLTDVEYELQPCSVAKIMVDGIEGENLASNSIKLIATGLDFGKEMESQTGAVYTDRQGMTTDSGNNTSSAKKKDITGILMRSPMPAKRLDPFTQSDIQKSASMVADAFDDASGISSSPDLPEMNRSSSISKSLQVSSNSTDAESVSEERAYPAKEEENARRYSYFALPKELTDKFIKSECCYDYSIKPTYCKLDLINSTETLPLSEFGFEWLESSPDIEVKFATFDKNHYQIHLKGIDYENLSMSDAMLFEKQGMFSQAASLWLRLGKKYNIKPAILNKHLERLIDKMLK